LVAYRFTLIAVTDFRPNNWCLASRSSNFAISKSLAKCNDSCSSTTQFRRRTLPWHNLVWNELTVESYDVWQEYIFSVLCVRPVFVVLYNDIIIWSQQLSRKTMRYYNIRYLRYNSCLVVKQIHLYTGQRYFFLVFQWLTIILWKPIYVCIQDTRLVL